MPVNPYASAMFNPQVYRPSQTLHQNTPPTYPQTPSGATKTNHFNPYTPASLDGRNGPAGASPYLVPIGDFKPEHPPSTSPLFALSNHSTPASSASYPSYPLISSSLAPSNQPSSTPSHQNPAFLSSHAQHSFPLLSPSSTPSNIVSTTLTPSHPPSQPSSTPPSTEPKLSYQRPQVLTDSMYSFLRFLTCQVVAQTRERDECLSLLQILPPTGRVCL